ncbi:MAG: hypothetical protein JRJ87_22310 [Deltaproteobacteria bacterium]|nr:hypothetical protein [Deltaproteobacteria bacterium]
MQSSRRFLIASLLLVACAATIPACVHTQRAVRFNGPAALALEVLARELTALGLQTASMHEQSGVLRTQWEDLGFLYGQEVKQESTLFRRYLVVIHRRPADSGLTLRAEVQVCQVGTRVEAERLVGRCSALPGLIELHQSELDELGRQLKAALSRLRPSPEASPPATVLAVFELQAPLGLLPEGVAANLTDYLVSKLAGTGRFQVVPGETVRQAIRDRQRDSYKKAYGTEFQIELGRAVAANQLLSTQLLATGKACILSASLYNIASETTQAAVTVESGCALEELPEGLDRLVLKLVDAQ